MNIQLNTWNPDRLEANLRYGSVKFKAIGDGHREHQHLSAFGVPAKDFVDLPFEESRSDENDHVWKSFKVGDLTLTFHASASDVDEYVQKQAEVAVEEIEAVEA